MLDAFRNTLTTTLPHTLKTRFPVVLYAVALVLAALWLHRDYLSGRYTLALIDTLLLPFLVFCALHTLINDMPLRHFWGAKGAMAAALCVAVCQVYFNPNVDAYVIAYLAGLAAYGCLSLTKVAAYQMVLLAGVLLAGGLAGRGVHGVEQGVFLGLFSGLFWLSINRYLMAARRLKRLSVKDIESDTYNRRHFYDVLEKELNRTQSDKAAISLIGVHLEDLDQIADLYGQETVTRFLPSFVEYLRQQIRTGDDIFRLNSDVFVLTLDNCSEDGARIFMERIKRSFTDFSVPPFSEVSLSVASVMYHPPEQVGAIEQRLLAQLKKQKKAIMNLSVFSDAD